MMAITVQQPWAWAIIHANPPKHTENRTRFPMWKRAVGQTIAIHAGLRWSDRGAWDDRVIRAYSQTRGLTDSLIPTERDTEFDRGAIIGTVHVRAIHAALTDCCEPWGEHTYVEHGGRTRSQIVHLVLDNPRPLDVPEPCRGALGLWTVPAHVAQLLEAVPR